ncbi:APC family permease [Nocardioides dongxiaopingii]|uniref:APC family permease n=1 Tax=Nocardioides sp. S-1144 TaxID=2582905 RepID=UPI00110D6393|nr:APC family permease [Nocardioides sp. S-1144]QCW50024.1 APC family permease [Nocardioides sp. S-1144]
MTDQPVLARRLGTGDAVVVGLTAMIGAGVFSVFAPAAEAAGSLLLVGLGLAAVVATCNAVASAQLASAHPASGGAYLFGREVLGPWWGFVAGWGFVVGKTASCAAMAMTFAAYAVPGEEWVRRLAAVAAVVLLTAATVRGITRTALLARVLLGLTALTLVVALVVVAGGDAAAPAGGWTATGGLPGVLQSAGLLFFAFAGYARIATLAEEVRTPETLGRAVLVALGVVVVLYALVAVALLHVLGEGLAGSGEPVAAAVEAAGAPWAEPVVRVGAAAASLGALLALLAGIGRTSLAMARERDLPSGLAAVHPRHRVPHHAQLVVGAAVVGLVLVADLRGAIGFSSFGVLVYYAVANLAALRQPVAARRWPRAVNVTGLLGCVVLGASLPVPAVVAGLAVVAVGVAGRLVRLRVDRRTR